MRIVLSFFIILFLFLYPVNASGGETATYKQSVGLSSAEDIDLSGNNVLPIEKVQGKIIPVPTKSPVRAWGIFEDFPRNLSWAIASGFVGLFLVMVTDWLKTPILYIEEGAQSGNDPKHPLGNFRIIHIRVRNKKKKFWFLPIALSTAFSTQAKVVLHNNLQMVEFAGKWSNTPQPILSGQVQPDMVFIPPKMDIYPSDGKDDEAQELAIGIKYDGEDEFYAFNLESYLYQNKLKHPNRKFDIGTYSGGITFSSLGNKYKKGFKIYNKTSNIKDFHLKVL